MRIILDSTAYRADLLLEGNAFRILFANLERIGAKIIIPEVALEEVVNAFREDIEKFAASSKKMAKEAQRLKLDHTISVFPAEKVGTEVSKYRHRLQSLERTEIAPIPDTAHKELLKRDLSRRKPFKSTGTGYRDTLIWETVLGVLQGSQTPVCFVTNNISDFWQSEELHPDLASSKCQSSLLTLFTTVSGFWIHVSSKCRSSLLTLFTPRSRFLTEPATPRFQEFNGEKSGGMGGMGAMGARGLQIGFGDCFWFLVSGFRCWRWPAGRRPYFERPGSAGVLACRLRPIPPHNFLFCDLCALLWLNFSFLLLCAFARPCAFALNPHVPSA